MASFNWPPTGGGVPIYANLAAFPVTATIGDLGVAADTGDIYEWRGSSWVLVAGPGAIVVTGNLTDAGTDGITITGGTGAVVGSGTSIAQHVSDASHNGYLSSADWTTFNSKQAALTIGNLTDAGTDGITVTGGTGSVIGSGTSIAQHVADASHNGYLSSADWTTFNSKGSGSVTSVSIVSANGLAGTVATATTTPAITLSTTITGILQGNGTAISAATTGNLTDAGTDGITITGGSGSVLGSGTSIAQHVADTTHNGYLSSTDWNTFNSKQAALTIGDLTDVGTDGITVTGGTGSVIGSGTSISQHVADTTHNGYLSSTDWNTFNGKQPSGTYVTSIAIASSNGLSGSSSGGATPTLTLSTSITGILQGNGTAISAATTGNLTDAGTDGITVTAGTGAVLGSGTSIAQHVADTTHNGYLSSTDWNTFNGKQASGNYITDLTGDGTASGPGSVALTLATVNTNTGSFGSSTSIPNFTVNGKGLITAAGGNVVIAPAGTLSGTTLNSTVVTSSLTSVGTIATGTWQGTAVGVGYGGTGQTTYTDGQLLIGNSSGNTLTKATITAGSNITVTNGNGSITIAASSSTAINFIPTTQSYTSGTSTFNLIYGFVITSGSATVGATYTNNSVTFTVYSTVASQTKVFLSGNGAPTSSGTLTKASGTGDATLTFSSFATPLYLEVEMCGSGGGGSSSGTAAGNDGAAGNNSTFGSSLLTAGGGAAGVWATNGGVGGTNTISSPAIAKKNVPGSHGQGVTVTANGGGEYMSGGYGGSSGFGILGAGGTLNAAAPTPTANVGCGGGGGATNSTANNYAGGGGGGAGYLIGIIPNPSATYSAVVGAAASGGSAGTNGFAGASSSAGVINITCYYQ